MSLFDTKSLFPLKSKESVYAMLRFPIQPASVLLNRDSCQNLLETLQIILPKPLYRQYYYSAIERFATYVQILPAKRQGIFSEIEGLLDYSLSRATYTLTTGLSYLYPDQKDFHKLQHSPIRSVELYAAFTAALFRDIGLLIHYYEITLYDQDEKEIQLWKPFEGSVLDITDAAFLSFKYVEESARFDLINGCLASTILSGHPQTRSGFLWIAKYPQTLETWLAVLMEEIHRVPPETVLALLPFADKQAIDKRLQEKAQIKKIGSSRTKNWFYEGQLATESENRILGDRFLNWLRKRASSNELAINTNDNIGVRRIREGLLIARSELLTFSELHQVNPESVEKQFREIVALYPPSMNERARQSSSLGGVAQVALGQWLLAYNPSLIFGLGRIPPIFLASTPVSPPISTVNFTKST